MVKGIIENTHIISSKITKFIWFLGYYNFFKMDMYFETEFTQVDTIKRADERAQTAVRALAIITCYFCCKPLDSRRDL